MIRTTLALIFFGISFSPLAYADEVLRTEKLAENVYALIGPLTNRDPVNLGNNANFGVIVTTDGVVLIDPGATYRGAQMIQTAIDNITNQPVKWVINSGGQDHRWLGNGYFRERGAKIIASENAISDQKTRTRDQLNGLYTLVGAEGVAGTTPVYADESFRDKQLLTPGGTRIEIYHSGPAHTPGDSFVWLPEHDIVFAGDIVYTDRMLGIGSQSQHLGWIGAFEAMQKLQPGIVVGGHGNPASLSKATSETYDYLVFLRKAVQKFMDEGNGMEEIGIIDQARFSYLENYDALKGRNAQRVYEELEWE